MVCPECKREFSTTESSVCPYCGMAVASGVVKTSTILISAGSTEGVYRSVEEVPDPLRSRLIESTSGLNSATIIIADGRGRKEISRAIRNLPATATESTAADPPPERHPVISPLVLRWLAAFLFLTSAVLIWLAFTAR